MSESRLLEEVLDAHGGLERWRSARTVSARVRTGGLLPRTRMPGNRFADTRALVDVIEPRVRFDPFPGGGRVGIFDHGEVRVETGDGEVLEARSDPRSAFAGLSGLRRNLRWDALDSVYFAGYAIWNYLTTPLLLARDGVEVTDGDDWQEPGVEEPWRRLEVSFPDDLDTHSSRQTFYFDPLRLLRRHDYVPEVIGGWARAAHYTSEHTDAAGLVFPTRRRVRPIGVRNRALAGPTLVSIDLCEIEIGSA